MGSNETAITIPGGPRVIDVFDGNGAPSEAKRISDEAAARLKRLTDEMLERNASIMPSLRIS